MSTEVVTATVGLTNALTLVAALVGPHQYASVYVQSAVAAANGSRWEVWGVAGTTKWPIAKGNFVVPSDTTKGALVIAKADISGAQTLELRAKSFFGAAAGVKLALVGYDPNQAVAQAAANAPVTFNVGGTEQDVFTLATTNPVVQGSVDASAANALGLGSVWRLYTTVGGFRTLVAVTPPLTNGALAQDATPPIPKTTPNPQDLFGVVDVGSDGYVLTAQQQVGTATAACQASLVASDLVGGGSTSAVTLAGNVVGPSNANTLQSVSGGFGGHAGFVSVDVGAFFGFSAFANLAATGALRFGNATNTTIPIITCRDATGGHDLNVVSTQAGVGAVIVQLGDPSAFDSRLTGTSARLVSALAQFVCDGTGQQLFSTPQIFSNINVGALKWDSDANLTGYKWSLNSVEMFQHTSTKFNPEKGQRSAVTVITDANYTVLTTDYFVALADTPTATRTFTLPASPTAGDTYEISVGALAGFSLVISGNTANINGNGTVTMTGDYTNFRITFISAGAGWRIT